MVTIDFDEIPATLRVPGVFGQFDASKAVQRPQRKPLRILIIAQQLSSATQPALTPLRVRNKDEAAQYWGVGSQMHASFAAWFLNNDFQEVWGIGVADPSGVAATYTLTLTGTATLAGTAAIWIAGRRFELAWAASANTTTLATALAALINLDTSLPVTAGSSTNVVTLTARHVGVMGNDIDVRHSHQDGEALPPGASVAIAVGVAGTGNPVVSPVWTAIGDSWFDIIAMPFTDTTALTSTENETERRSKAMIEIDMVSITGKTGTLSTASTLGNARNSKDSCLFGTNGSPTPPWEVAAMVAGQAAASVANDPTRPFKTLELIGMIAPKITDRFTLTDQNSLLYSGISTFTIDVDGTCRIQELISTYKTNAAGGADRSWLLLNTRFAATFYRWSLVNHLKVKFPRHKKGKDGGNYGGGQLVVTQSTLKGEIILHAGALEEEGIVEDIEQFARDCVVTDNATPTRFDVQVSPNFVNGLGQIAIKISFLE